MPKKIAIITAIVVLIIIIGVVVAWIAYRGIGEQRVGCERVFKVKILKAKTDLRTYEDVLELFKRNERKIEEELKNMGLQYDLNLDEARVSGGSQEKLYCSEHIGVRCEPPWWRQMGYEFTISFPKIEPLIFYISDSGDVYMYISP